MKKLLWPIRIWSNKEVKVHWLCWRLGLQPKMLWKGSKSLELLLSSILNPCSHVDPNFSYKRCFDKTFCFSHGIFQTIFTVISSKVLELWHKTKYTWHSAAPPPNIFSLLVSLPWNARGNKILLHFFTIYETLQETQGACAQTLD